MSELMKFYAHNTFIPKEVILSLLAVMYLVLGCSKRYGGSSNWMFLVSFAGALVSATGIAMAEPTLSSKMNTEAMRLSLWWMVSIAVMLAPSLVTMFQAIADNKPAKALGHVTLIMVSLVVFTNLGIYRYYTDPWGVASVIFQFLSIAFGIGWVVTVGLQQGQHRARTRLQYS